MSSAVCLALLTGSDYTEGVETVGPVTAMEILAEFPGDGLAPLQEFAAWRGRVGAGLGGEVVGSRAREKLRRLQLPVSFPSLAVQAAYLQPSVDTSTQPFSWAVPNLVAVRSELKLKCSNSCLDPSSVLFSGTSRVKSSAGTEPR